MTQTSSTLTPPADAPQSGSAPLVAADRCDRCGAQAYVRVTLPVGELLFCGHHAREHAAAYSDIATHIQDETDRLLKDAATR